MSLPDESPNGPRVRVYLPTYRRPHLLPRAIASLRAQTVTNWICELHNDDPADDHPARLLAELNDARFQLVTHPRTLGGTATFNLFFAGTREPFFSLLEDDNWWNPDFLATMLEVADANPDVTLLWANMHLWREDPDGSFKDTGNTTWPLAANRATTRFAWGGFRQMCGALHSNGAALFRSQPGADYRVPEIPFGVIEQFRERMFPHPILLVNRPLAHFSITQQTARRRDPAEWAATQAILAATYLRHAQFDDASLAALWEEARAKRPPATSALIAAALATNDETKLLQHARWQDWWVVLRGFARRPRIYFCIRRSRRERPEWWAFLDRYTALRWQEQRERARALPSS